MRRAWGVEQIREAERVAMAEVGDDALMQRASAGLAASVVRLLREGGRVRGTHALLVVGAGNNGGDALFAGERLARRGVRVSVWAPFGRRHEAGWAALRAAEGRETDAVGAMAALADTDVVIDGLLGIGGRAGLSDEVLLLAQACTDAGLPVVSVDLPSGLDADRPTAEPSFVATHTVTFGGLKPCHLSEPAAGRCGDIELIDIGLDLPDPVLVAWNEADVARVWPVPDASSDKYSRGVVGLDTGSDQYPGAGLLGALGTVYSGAGMVRSMQPRRVTELVQHHLPTVVAGAGRVQALVLGSGWGERPDGAATIEGALAAGAALVVDADGLRHVPRGLGADPDRLLLTPHAGELARLLGVERSAVEADPVTHAQQAADQFGATVVLKGASQYVARPGERQVSLAVPGPAWTAQAGSGDVLAGICGTLLAAGLSAHDAALAAASVQAMTAARLDGPYPADEVARHLPATIGELAQATRARLPIASR